MLQQHPVQTATDTPPNVYEQATVYQLGNQGPTYKPVFPNVLAALGMMIGVVIADIVLLYIIVTLTGYIFYILVIIPILAIIYGISALRNRDLRVYQFENGIIQAKGTRLDVIRWDAVAFVNFAANNYRGYYAGGVIGAMFAGRNRSSSSITVQRNDGASFKFGGSLRNSRQLIETLSTAVLQAHLPRATAAYNSGSPVTFGPLTVSQQGLSNGNNLLPWNEVKSATIVRGQVIIKKAGKTFNWAHVSVARVPNVLVFLSLVNYARTGNPY